MVSKTLSHLETYNKELRYDVFFENFNGGLIRDDEKSFYANLMYAIYKCCPKFDKNPKSVEFFEEEYEKNIANNDEAKKEIYGTYETMAMINSWLNYKQIYRFDEDTMNLLMESECKDMTFEELKKVKLPYECFSIENEIEYDDKIIDTIFFNRMFDDDSNEMLLMIYGVCKGNGFQLLKLNIVLESDTKEVQNTLFKELDERCLPKAVDFFKKIMNLVLYLCQPKVEILKKRVEKKEDTTDKKKIKHFYRVSYDSNDVGVELGNAIRNYRYVYEKGESTPGKKGSVKKPHLRCGHFQRYWLGSRKIEKREFVVKYIPPIFVKGGASKIATLHNVK